MSLGSICVRHLGSDPLVLCFIQCVLLSLCLGPKTGRCRLVAGGVGGNDLPHWGHEAHTHKEEELFFYRVKLSCLTPNTHPVYPPPHSVGVGVGGTIVVIVAWQFLVWVSG